jgi:hypothetical protein
MKLLESGAFVKDYEGPDKEIEQAVQMVISQIASDDPRFLEKDPPPLSEEFPEGCEIFFLGEHAYGVAAQVASTTNDTLSVILTVCDNGDDAVPLAHGSHSSSHRIKLRTTSSKPLCRAAFLSSIIQHSRLPTCFVSLVWRFLRLRPTSWS